MLVVAKTSHLGVKSKDQIILKKSSVLAVVFLFSKREAAVLEELLFQKPKMIKKTKKLIIFALLFVILILTPIGLNQYYKFLLQPITRTGEEKMFIVKPGASVAQIAKNLEKEKLIKNALAFRLLVAQMGIGKTIQAGDFRLMPTMSSRQIAQELTHGAIDIWITFPEGLRVEEMADKIEAKLKNPTNDKYQFDKKEFLKLAKEGYMFPDTYLIAKDATAKDIATRLTTTFDEKVDQKLLGKGKQNNLTAEEVITLASLIEREARTDEEKAVIAGILINRLNAGIALQVDATVQYAKGYSAANNTWWPQVTTDDYQSVRSPYNTYLAPGLPPGPISSPGLASIRAAAEPQDTPYLYYLHDTKGKIHYAKTVDEHNENIKKYL